MPTPEGLERINAYYAGLTERAYRDLADFAEDEQAVLFRFVERSLASATEEADRMGAGS
ncbi:MAG: hypothetical protein ABIQ18_10780 [Umezawaea sp.]